MSAITGDHKLYNQLPNGPPSAGYSLLLEAMEQCAAVAPLQTLLCFVPTWLDTAQSISCGCATQNLLSGYPPRFSSRSSRYIT